MNIIIETALTIIAALFLIGFTIYVLTVIWKGFIAEPIARLHRRREDKRKRLAEWERHMNGDHMGLMKAKFRFRMEELDAEAMNYQCGVCHATERRIIYSSDAVLNRSLTFPDVLS